jgi:hypothetical protein
MSKKATVNRTFTVSDGRTLTLPLLSLHSLEVASSYEAAAYVVEYIHNPESIGMPHVNLFRDCGIIIQTLNNTTAHVLVVADDEQALNHIAKYHHTYSKLGYTLIFDETTFLAEMPKISKSGDSSESPSTPTGMESEPRGASASTPRTQTKLDVIGMEVA